MRPTLENAELILPMFLTGIKSRVMKTTITDNFQITKEMPFFMWLDPNGGNKDVRLPVATTIGHEGLFYIIINDADAAESLVIKNAGETETVVTLGQGNVGLVFNDGASLTGWIGVVLDQTTSETVTNLTATGNVSVAGTLGVTGVTTLTDLDLGASGTAGTLDVFPSTAAKGKLALTITDQTGDTTVSLVIGAMAAARTVTLRDPGAAASFLTTTDATAAATDATAVEITRACDVSARMVSVGGTALTLTVATHSDKIIKLDHTAAASTVTLPDATGSGAKFTFIVTGLNVSGGHLIKVPDANNVFRGSINNLDVDASAQAAFATAATSDTITLNGTTTGGQIGDTIELVDIAADTWQVWGQVVCPAGSNVATPFSATV